MRDFNLVSEKYGIAIRTLLPRITWHRQFKSIVLNFNRELVKKDTEEKYNNFKLILSHIIDILKLQKHKRYYR